MIQVIIGNGRVIPRGICKSPDGVELDFVLTGFLQIKRCSRLVKQIQTNVQYV